MQKLSFAGLGLGALSVAAFACSASGAKGRGQGGEGGAVMGSPTSGATGSAVASSSGAGTFASTGAGVACSAPCGQGDFCSVDGQCIPLGTCLEDADCSAMGTVCDKGQKQCVPGGCSSVEIPAASVPPNLLIVLDRSCSMQEAIGNSTKWAIAVGAIEKLTTDYAAKIRFGLTLFPDLVKPDCLQDKIPIPTAPGNEAAIQKLLTASLSSADAYYPKGPCVTNIDTAMQQAQTDPALTDASRADYVVLLTDGEQEVCKMAGGDPTTIQAIDDLAKQGVHTFVIGFGQGVGVTSLDNFANAGLEPNKNGPNAFYDAADQATLDAVFAQIATKTASCVFQLKSPPADPTQIYAFFDGQSVPHDPKHQDGWDFDAGTDQVTFYGMACDELKQGKVKKVQVVYGCDMLPH